MLCLKQNHMKHKGSAAEMNKMETLLKPNPILKAKLPLTVSFCRPNAESYLSVSKITTSFSTWPRAFSIRCTHSRRTGGMFQGFLYCHLVDGLRFASYRIEWTASKRRSCAIFCLPNTSCTKHIHSVIV